MRSSSKIKVTHILTDSNIGGAGRLLRYFLEEADREQFEYSVILPEDAALIPEIEANPELEIVGEPFEFEFDEEGYFKYEM